MLKLRWSTDCSFVVIGCWHSTFTAQPLRLSNASALSLQLSFLSLHYRYIQLSFFVSLLLSYFIGFLVATTQSCHSFYKNLTLATIYVLPNVFQGKIIPFKIIAINNCFPALLYTRYVYAIATHPINPLFFLETDDERRRFYHLSLSFVCGQIEGNMIFYLILLQSSMTAHVKRYGGMKIRWKEEKGGKLRSGGVKGSYREHQCGIDQSSWGFISLIADTNLEARLQNGLIFDIWISSAHTDQYPNHSVPGSVSANLNFQNPYKQLSLFHWPIIDIFDSLPMSFADDKFLPSGTYAIINTAYNRCISFNEPDDCLSTSGDDYGVSSSCLDHWGPLLYFHAYLVDYLIPHEQEVDYSKPLKNIRGYLTRCRGRRRCGFSEESA